MKESNNDKNWFMKHKVLTAILAVVLISIIGVAAGGGSKSSTNNNGSGGSKSSKQAKEYKFNDRADKQEKDVEVAVGEPAEVGGVSMTLTDGVYATSLGEYDKAAAGKTYFTATVSLENKSDRTEAYNIFDFRIQTAGGQVLDGTIALGGEGGLSSGDLVAGGKVSGKIFFEVPVEEGSQFVIWKPGVGSDRAIVKVK
jgi:hypothetical protein